MPNSDATLIAVLQEQVKGVREDVTELVAETQRTRKRLHDLEGLAQAQVEAQRLQRQHLDDRQRRTEVRMEVLSVLVAVAAIIVPIVTVALHFQ